MQRILQRAARAKRKRATQKRKESAIQYTAQKQLWRLESDAHTNERLSLIKLARQRRKEDAILGPLLAPRRDVLGKEAETYGTVGLRMLRGAERPRLDPKIREWGIREGDRVVVVGEKERDRGKMGVVREIRERAEDCFVKGINLVDVPTPASNRALSPQSGPITTTEASIPLSSVRLVHPLPDPSNNNLPKDTLIQSLTVSTKPRRLPKGRPSRWITGLDPPTAIPWPDEGKEEEDLQEEDHPMDTLRIDVEQRTWVPNLMKDPFPDGVMDELRNKFGKFRTRHEEKFVERLERQERFEEEVGVKMRESVMTPKERMVRERKAREEKEKAEGGGPKERELSEELLARIGALMRKSQGDVERVGGLEGMRKRLEYWDKGEEKRGGDGDGEVEGGTVNLGEGAKAEQRVEA